MAKDLVSMTPLAEYLDMLWTRMAIEMPKHEHVTNWWISLHPPGLDGRPSEGVGFTELHALTGNKRIAYHADMHAVQHGAQISTDILEQVVEIHISKFVEALAP